MASATVDLLPWSEETFHQIPMDRVIFDRIQKQTMSEDAFSIVRSIFMKHNVQRSHALCVVHRHFDLNPSERLVEYNNVSAPWCIDESPDYLQPGIVPKNWAFVKGGLFPYEYRFNAGANSPDADPVADTPPAAFVMDLREALERLGLDDAYGIGTLDADDLDLSTPGKFEFTAGRTSVVVPFTKEMEKMARVQAAWVFCANPFSGGFGDDEKQVVKGRICALQCRGHGSGGACNGAE